MTRDPDDDRLIEAAPAAHVDVIVTGDRDLLTLSRIDDISILPHESSSESSRTASDP